MKKKIILMILLVFLVGCAEKQVKQEFQVPKNIETGDDSLKDPSGLTKETCSAYWNECSSPCLGTNADVCVQVCVPRCECFDKYFCPEGYICKVGSYNKNKGVCVKVQDLRN